MWHAQYAAMSVCQQPWTVCAFARCAKLETVSPTWVLEPTSQAHGQPDTMVSLTTAADANKHFIAQVMDEVRAALAANPGYRLQLVGHSMGAGTAAILTMMCVSYLFRFQTFARHSLQSATTSLDICMPCSAQPPVHSQAIGSRAAKHQGIQCRLECHQLQTLLPRHIPNVSMAVDVQ